MMKTLLILCLIILQSACALTTTQTSTLYERLGGRDVLAKISTETIEATAKDPKTSRSFKDVKLTVLSESLTSFLCIKTGGECVYEGETIKKSHQDLHITTAEFELMVQILRNTLDRHDIANADKNALLKILAPMKKEVVNP